VCTSQWSIRAWYRSAGVGLRTGRGDVLLGPDNGLLIEAAEALGGIVEARALENRTLMLPGLSDSFHGRDASRPSPGTWPRAVRIVGPVVPMDRLVRLPAAQATIGHGVLESVIVRAIYGNVTLAGTPADLEAAIGRWSGRPIEMSFPAHDEAPAVEERTAWARTFGDVPLGASLLYSDSEGQLALADNQGDAAGRLGLVLDRPVRITPG
jgi:S-adenosylmethionine hydrolase